MAKPPTYEPLRLELDAAASPARVAVVARMMSDALAAAGLDTLGGTVTLVVDNFDLGATVRPRDQKSSKAVNLLGFVVENPVAAVQKHTSVARDVAKALGDGAKKLSPATGQFILGERVVARLDETLSKALSAVAERDTAPRDVTWGYGTTRSRVLKVGRNGEKSALTVTIKVENAVHEVKLDHAAAADFFDAAKRGDINVIRFKAAWVITKKSRVPHLDMKTVVATSIVKAQAPATGSDVANLARRLDGALSIDLEDVFDELGINL